MRKKLQQTQNPKIFGETLEQAIKKKFKNQIDFANQIGVTQATVSRYISGNALPSFQMLQKISETLQIDLSFINRTQVVSENPSHMLKIPMFYSEVSAGKGLMSLDSPYEYLYFDANWFKNQFIINNPTDVFSVRVKGDSMEPLIQEGDIVFAKKYEDNSINQGIYIVAYNDDFLIKKVQFKSKDSIKLISANTEYDPIDIDLKQEDTNFRIVAKVLGRLNVKSFSNSFVK